MAARIWGEKETLVEPSGLPWSLASKGGAPPLNNQQVKSRWYVSRRCAQSRRKGCVPEGICFLKKRVSLRQADMVMYRMKSDPGMEKTQ
jgi:hypothetical protein